jgi:hypothetical protein
LRLLNLIKSGRPTLAIFEAVFFLFLASLFYHPLLFVLLMVLIVTLVFVNPHWRYFVVPVFAISAVIILSQMFNILWHDKLLYAEFFWPEWHFQVIEFNSTAQIFSIVVWFLSILLFAYQAIKVLQKRALYHQKLATCFLYLALLAFLSSWFSVSNLAGLWMISIMPVSIYLGDFIFRLRKKLLSEILLWLFIIFSVVFSLIQN